MKDSGLKAGECLKFNLLGQVARPKAHQKAGMKLASQLLPLPHLLGRHKSEAGNRGPAAHGDML